MTYLEPMHTQNTATKTITRHDTYGVRCLRVCCIPKILYIFLLNMKCFYLVGRKKGLEISYTGITINDNNI